MSKKPKEVATVKETQAEEYRREDGFRITKVANKKDKISIGAEHIRNGEIMKTQLECDDKANPEFYEIMSKIGSYMGTMCGFPKDWIERARCTSVAVNYEDDASERMGCVVSMFIPLTKFNGGASFSTPHLRQKIQGEPGGGAFMPEDLLLMVKTALREAQRYMDGDRAQRSLVDAIEESEAE